MGSSPAQLYLLLMGMRLVGGFPFVEKRRKPQPDNKLTHPHKHIYKKQRSAFLTLLTTEDDAIFHKSTFWTCWTIMMGGAATLCFALGLWNLRSPTFGFPQDLASAFYAYKINEVMDNVTLAGLMFHVSYRRLRLREVVEFSYQLVWGLSSDTPVPRLPLSKFFPFTINLAATLSIIIFIIYGDMFDYMTTAVEVFQQVAFFVIGTSILCLFQWVVWLSIHEYECIIMSLNSCLGDAACLLGLTHHYEYRQIISPATTVSKNQVTCYSDIWPRTTKPTQSTGTRDLDSVFEVDHCLRDAKEKLIQVNKLLQLVRNYCGVPVTLMMLYSVVACILSLFYMSFLMQLETLNAAVTFLFTVNALVAPMFLCNVPYSLCEKVGEALFCYLAYSCGLLVCSYTAFLSFCIIILFLYLSSSCSLYSSFPPFFFFSSFFSSYTNTLSFIFSAVFQLCYSSFTLISYLLLTAKNYSPLCGR